MANRTVIYLTGRVFPPHGEVNELRDDQTILGSLMADVFRTTHRTTDDLLGLVVAATNGFFLQARACVDFNDGEVFVDTCLRYHSEELPESFDNSIGAVLQHAAFLAGFERTLKNLLAPDNPPASETLEAMCELFGRRSEAQLPDGRPALGCELGSPDVPAT